MHLNLGALVDKIPSARFLASPSASETAINCMCTLEVFLAESYSLARPGSTPRINPSS